MLRRSVRTSIETCCNIPSDDSRSEILKDFCRSLMQGLSRRRTGSEGCCGGGPSHLYPGTHPNVDPTPTPNTVEGASSPCCGGVIECDTWPPIFNYSTDSQQNGPARPRTNNRQVCHRIPDSRHPRLPEDDDLQSPIIQLISLTGRTRRSRDRLLAARAGRS